jgi:hypothetical protein
MARREVTEDDVPMAKFLKLRDLLPEDGATFVGLYQAHAPSTGEYGGTNYTFRCRDGSLGTVTVKGQLEALFVKAGEVEPLTRGEKVTITRVRSQPTSKGNDMIVYKIRVEDGPKGKPAPKSAPSDDFDE